jgi:hypothetical protein
MGEPLITIDIDAIWDRINKISAFFNGIDKKVDDLNNKLAKIQKINDDLTKVEVKINKLKTKLKSLTSFIHKKG